MLKHYNIKVSGRVQGVAYRYSAMRKAKNMNINGFVRNIIDGSVEIEAEAEEEILDQFYLWCKKGPIRARVDKITLSESNLNNFVNFKIR